MSQTTELVIKAVLGLISAVLVYRIAPDTLKARRVFIVLAVVSIAAWFNFGAFHSVRYPHYHEMFHYMLGSKYFPELGYDGLYAASLESQRRRAPDYPWPKEVRDLRKNVLLPGTDPSISLFQKEVAARFTPERWEAFGVDNDFFLQHASPGYVAGFRRDHGYNGTPAWTLISGTVSRIVPFTEWGVWAASLLDPLLLTIMFAVVWRTFGWAAACQAMVVFGLAFLSRFYWVGGSLLRHDWLVAATLGVCFLEQRRWTLAGLALGYATLARVFPAILLFGVAAWAIDAWRLQRFRWSDRPDWAMRVAFAFVGILAIGFVVGGLTGRGFGVWQEFVDAISRHRSGWSTNRLGMLNTIVYAYDLLVRPLSDWSRTVSSAEWAARTRAFHEGWWWVRAAAVAVILGLVALKARRGTKVQAAVVGVAAIFALTEPSSYYFSVVLLVPLAGDRKATAALLAHAALSSALAASPMRRMVYGVGSTAALVLILLWVWPEVRTVFALVRGKLSRSSA